MVGSILRRFGPFLPVLALLVSVGCATAGPKEIERLQGEEGSAAKIPPEGLMVETVNVVGEGDRILIASNGPVAYNVYSLIDPPRLVVDMPGVDLRKVSFPIHVDNDYVDGINAFNFPGEENAGRIVIGLKNGIEHEVKRGENSISVALKKEPLAEGKSLPLSGLTVAGGGAAENQVMETASIPLAPGPVEAPPVKPATAIREIELTNFEGGSVISIMADGDIARYSSFELKNPGRIVVDVWGVKNSTGKDHIKPKGALISSVRIGSHPDKIRFVFYTGATLPPYLVTKTGNYVVMTVGESALAKKATENAKEVTAPRGSENRILVALKEDSPEEKNSLTNGGGAVLPANPSGQEAAGPKTATSVKEVELMNFEGGSVVNIVADGEATRYSSFELKNPSRIVIDVWGVKNSTGKDSIKVKDSLIKSVRIGSHPEKTRFVFEMERDVPPYLVTKTENYIVMTVGATFAEKATENKEVSVTEVATGSGVASGEAAPETSANTEANPPSQPAQAPGPPEVAVAQTNTSPAQGSGAVTGGGEGAALGASAAALQSAQAPAPQAQEAAAVAAPVEEKKELIHVGRIDFRKIADRGILTVERTGPSPYAVKESKEGKTLVLDIKEATLPEELRRTLDATKLKTPVTSISSYQATPGEVRVLIELSQKTDYEIKEINSSITLSFALPPKAPAPEGVEGKVYTGRRIDLDMVDANVTDILRLLAEVSDLNIIASDDVVGTISLRLKNVPWDQAFDIILKAKNLGSIRDGNVVRVAPAAKIRQEEEAQLAAKKAQEKLEDMEIRFVPVNYAKADELEGQAKGVLSERGSVSTDARTNTLIIKDIKSGIEAAEGLVKRLDSPIPQVLIEARIVEAETSFARDLGIQWGIDYQTTGNLSTDTFGSSSTSGQTPPSSTTFPAFETHHGADNFAVNLPATGTAGPLGALGFVLGKTGQNPLVLDLRLSAGEQEGRLRTISRPKIVTMDNREAKIEQGESIPFETTSAAGTMTTFIDANLSLTVTPHITPDGSILMRIRASRNSVGTFRTAAGEPSINKKEASTEVLVRDGETTVIGGIVISDNSETDKGIPYLKDIPLLGALFKSKSVSDSQEELLIFITPTIIKEKAVRDNTQG